MEFRQAPKGRVLLADDNEEIRSVLAELIEWEGWQVIQARDGNEALQKALKEKPDIVILDYRMPGMTGGQVSRRLREWDVSLPIILISAEPSGKQLAVESGVRHFLAKPFTSSTLISALEHVQGDL